MTAMEPFTVAGSGRCITTFVMPSVLPTLVLVWSIQASGTCGSTSRARYSSTSSPRGTFSLSRRSGSGSGWPWRSVWSSPSASGTETAALRSHDVAVGAPLLKTVWAAVSAPDAAGELQTDRKGHPLPDPDLRDNENVPLGQGIKEYLAREVLPHVPDAWIDDKKTKVGYEIPFTRHFYVYTPPRQLAEIDAEMKELEAEIQRLLGEVTA